MFSRTDSAGARSFLTDALGSTIALADPSGAITTSYSYEPFGAATSSGASSTGFAGGGWIVFGVVIDASIAGAVASAAGVVASAISLMTAQTTGQRVLAGAALVTSFLFPPAGIAAGVFAALWVSIALTRYVVDEANS